MSFPEKDLDTSQGYGDDATSVPASVPSLPKKNPQ
jgi:hypothetical protein